MEAENGDLAVDVSVGSLFIPSVVVACEAEDLSRSTL
jgi:hypothetical protein